MSCAQEQDLREQILLAQRSLKASASRPPSQRTFMQMKESAEVS